MSYERVQIDGDGQVDAEHVNRIQTNIKRALDDVEQDDRQVKVTFAAASTDTRIYHNLGRPLVGYRVVRASAFVNWKDGSPSSDPTRFFNVQVSAGGVTLTFEVF